MHASFTELFAINIPAWQLMLRGSVMYWVLFLMLRFVMRRVLPVVSPCRPSHRRSAKLTLVRIELRDEALDLVPAVDRLSHRHCGGS